MDNCFNKFCRLLLNKCWYLIFPAGNFYTNVTEVCLNLQTFLLFYHSIAMVREAKITDCDSIIINEFAHLYTGCLHKQTIIISGEQFLIIEQDNLVQAYGFVSQKHTYNISIISPWQHNIRHNTTSKLHCYVPLKETYLCAQQNCKSYDTS